MARFKTGPIKGLITTSFIFPVGQIPRAIGRTISHTFPFMDMVIHSIDGVKTNPLTDVDYAHFEVGVVYAGGNVEPKSTTNPVMYSVAADQVVAIIHDTRAINAPASSGQGAEGEDADEDEDEDEDTE